MNNQIPAQTHFATSEPQNPQNPHQQQPNNNDDPQNPNGNTAKKKKPRESITLKASHFQKQNGIHDLYQMSSKLQLDENSVQQSMAKIVNLFKTWHFNMIPRYSFELFLQRTKKLGNEKELQNYLQKTRRVHKGEDQWNIVRDEGPGRAVITDEHSERPPEGETGVLFGESTANRGQNNSISQYPKNEGEETIEEKMQRAMRLVNSVTTENEQRDGTKKQEPSGQGQVGKHSGQGYFSRQRTEQNENEDSNDEDNDDECEELFRQMQQVQKERREILEQSASRSKPKQSTTTPQEESQPEPEQPYVPQGFDDMDYDD